MTALRRGGGVVDGRWLAGVVLRAEKHRPVNGQTDPSSDLPFTKRVRNLTFQLRTGKTRKRTAGRHALDEQAMEKQ